MTIGETIKRYRKRKGLTQEELATQINVARGNLAKYERDIIKEIPLDVKIKLAMVLDFDVQEILSDKDKKLFDGTFNHLISLETKAFDELKAKLIANQHTDRLYPYAETENYLCYDKAVLKFVNDKFDFVQAIKDYADFIIEKHSPEPPQDEDTPAE